MGKNYYTYILANKRNNVVYVGVSDDLVKRVWQHKNKVVKGFTQKYNVDRLVYYEIYENPEEAINREKQLKGGSRDDKVALVNKMNSEWKDLYEGLF
ncbi:GIY-YIG nuclease family protein [Patescibacteria group bacterium]|nr:GIY-YIG nuclease family protein [Patescibacteria group bacterium]MBU4098026.1 GIY-YIG nuclease family protein [Patescibacteria group bacterium]